MREKISACVITYNEAANIRRCLDSLTWCDEIVIVDSFSEDATPRISREYTDRFFQHEWHGYIAQKEYTGHKAAHEWLFFLDADEEVSPELRDEILAEFNASTVCFNGFRFPRRVFYLGQWIYHGDWYPDIKLRLFRKSKGGTVGTEPHDQVVVKGPIKTLHNPIYHYTYEDISHQLNTLNRFSTITAREKWKRGARFTWFDMLFRSIWRFFRGYLLKTGFLDGKRGLIIALINAFGVAMKYAKLWEIEREQGIQKKR